MQIFVINLNSSTDRLEAVDTQLKSLGVTYTRIEAVNGKALSQEEKRKAVNNFRWWCAVGRKPTDGEIGCALSHASIYQRMIEDKIPFACVMEDDVVLDKRFPYILAELEKQLQSQKSCVWLLSNHSDSKGQIGDRHTGFSTPEGNNSFCIKKTSGDFCAECYVVTNMAAHRIFKVNTPMITPCDWWGRWKRIKIINLFHVFPTVASQNKDGYNSMTVPGLISPVNQMHIMPFIVHKLKRAFGLVVDRVLTVFLSR